MASGGPRVADTLLEGSASWTDSEKFRDGRGQLLLLRSGHCPKVFYFNLNIILRILHFILPISQKMGCKKRCPTFTLFPLLTMLSGFAYYRLRKMTPIPTSSPSDNVVLPLNWLLLNERPLTGKTRKQVFWPTWSFSISLQVCKLIFLIIK